ncbi:MAG: plasma-membrane proton-efflux P-type ATPase [Acidimicrobiia bacterium]|nr:plasma-membrane proton-efflux P-type ATPase [Acidimicrobiia bacterium]
MDDLDVTQLLGTLTTSAEGLSGQEAERRLSVFGPNEIPEKRHNPLLQLLVYFWGPIPWMIEVALILSLVVRDWSDAAIIGLLLVANGLIGFWEEHQAGNAIAALKEKLAATAHVKRDGSWGDVPACELVPGDVVLVRLGDVVPADTRILSGSDLLIDQSTLTGESLPVTRSSGDSLYSGSVAVKGEAHAVVTRTGTQTYFGRTAELVETAGNVSHFQQAVIRVGRFLIMIAVVLVVAMFVVGVLRGNDFVQMLQFALVVTVAAVPVALPTVLSVTMAIGASRLAGEHAVVSHLPAIEEIGGIDVLCSDKTGTLTRNELHVRDPFVMPGGDDTSRSLLLDAALASNADNGDPIDVAVLDAFAAGGLSTDGWTVDDFVPFDPVSKRTEATVTSPAGDTVQVSKGAPQVILGLGSGGDGTREYEGAVAEFASKGFRSLGVARKTGADGAWHVCGVLPLSDPPREDCAATIAEAQKLNVKVKMVTGDALAIAREVSDEVGLGPDIVDASVLSDADADETGLKSMVEAADGFAQVFPEHKHKIVELLQQAGHLVGMTGDGVNDAPALKQADAGIAVSGATDAARAAADIVLLSPGLSVIVTAIRQSRQIFERMTSYSIYRIAETIRVLFFVVLAIMVFDYFPVTALMIVLLALLNDGAIISIAYDNAETSITPKGWNLRRVLTIATVLGLTGVVESFLLLAFTKLGLHLGDGEIQSIIYLKLSIAGHLTIFVARRHGPLWSRPYPSRILLGAVIGTQLVATTIVKTGLLGFHALPWAWIGIVWVYTLVWMFAIDAMKLLTYRVIDRRTADGIRSNSFLDLASKSAGAAG